MRLCRRVHVGLRRRRRQRTAAATAAVSFAISTDVFNLIEVHYILLAATNTLSLCAWVWDAFAALARCTIVCFRGISGLSKNKYCDSALSQQF